MAVGKIPDAVSHPGKHGADLLSPFHVYGGFVRIPRSIALGRENWECLWILPISLGFVRERIPQRIATYRVAEMAVKRVDMVAIGQRVFDDNHTSRPHGVRGASILANQFAVCHGIDCRPHSGRSVTSL